MQSDVSSEGRKEGLQLPGRLRTGGKEDLALAGTEAAVMRTVVDVWVMCAGRSCGQMALSQVRSSEQLVPGRAVTAVANGLNSRVPLLPLLASFFIRTFKIICTLKASISDSWR
jgi:hypothetical protein